MGAENPSGKEIEVKIPEPILDALGLFQQYLDNNKSDRRLLAQALSTFIGYIPEEKQGELSNPIDEVSLEHQRALLNKVIDGRGGDWTSASLGIFSLKLESDRYPSVQTKIEELIDECSIVARTPLSKE